MYFFLRSMSAAAIAIVLPFLLERFGMAPIPGHFWVAALAAAIALIWAGSHQQMDSSAARALLGILAFVLGMTIAMLNVLGGLPEFIIAFMWVVTLVFAGVALTPFPFRR